MHTYSNPLFIEKISSLLVSHTDNNTCSWWLHALLICVSANRSSRTAPGQWCAKIPRCSAPRWPDAAHRNANSCGNVNQTKQPIQQQKQHNPNAGRHPPLGRSRVQHQIAQNQCGRQPNALRHRALVLVKQLFGIGKVHCVPFDCLHRSACRTRRRGPTAGGSVSVRIGSIGRQSSGSVGCRRRCCCCGRRCGGGRIFDDRHRCARLSASVSVRSDGQLSPLDGLFQ